MKTCSKANFPCDTAAAAAAAADPAIFVPERSTPFDLVAALDSNHGHFDVSS